MTDRKIRVLQVMDKCAIRGSPIHGVSRLLLTWWPAFEAAGFSFHLCVLRGGDGTCNAFAQIGVEVHDLSRHKVDPRTVTDIVRLVREHHIDVLHCHGYGATTFGRLAGRLCGVPVIVQEHMIDAAIPAYQRLVDRLLSPLTAAAVAVSHAVADFMVERRHIARDRLQVIHNTIPEEYCRDYSAEERAVVRARTGLPEGRRLVGIIGRLDEIKGHKDFITAAREVLRTHPEAYFVIVGDGELRQTLEAQVAAMGLEKDVSFLGHRDDILDIVALLDIFVSCSYSEGLPMAHAEAMALGVPVVATAVGGVPEIVEDGRSGLLVEAGRPDDIAAAIARVLADDALRQDLAEGGRRRCRDKFLVGSTVRQLGDLYRSLADRRGDA